jgi:tetratricopeptide (TPR) repeat protein
LDHYFRAIELKDDKFGEALREIEAALTFRVDDYWSWSVWSQLQVHLGATDSCNWGLSICIRLRPEEASAWLLRGHTGRDGPGNIADLSRALELTSDPVLRTMTYQQLANLRLASGQPKAALADCESALRLTPDDAGSLFRRAQCYQALGQMERAHADARKVLELTDQPTKGFWDHTLRMVTFRILGQPQREVEEALALFKAEALREWSLFWERSCEQDVDAHGAFVLAMVRCKLGDKEQARRWYDKGIQWIDKDKPKDKELLLFRDEAGKLLRIADLLQSAGLNAQKRQWDKAIADYTEAIRLDSKSLDAHMRRGNLFLETGDFKRARDDYSEAIRIDPKVLPAYEQRAYAHSRLGEFDRCVADCDAAIRVYPKSATAYTHRARGALRGSGSSLRGFRPAGEGSGRFCQGLRTGAEQRRVVDTTGQFLRRSGAVGKGHR